MGKCTVCGEEVEKYPDETGRMVDPTVHVMLTKQDPVTGKVTECIPSASGHQDCIEHRRIWDRIRKLEEYNK